MSNDPTAGIDPKGSEGAKKAPLHLLPSFPIHEAAWVLKLGADKYGEFNWRHNRVKASTYRSAMHRHLDQWFDGLEDVDAESGRSHLAHVISSAIIVLDAMKQGTLADDRPPRGVGTVESYNPRDAWMAKALGGRLSDDLPRPVRETIADLDEKRAEIDPFAGLPTLPEAPRGMKWERIPESEYHDDRHETGTYWCHSSTDAGFMRVWSRNWTNNLNPATDIVYIRPVPISTNC